MMVGNYCTMKVRSSTMVLNNGKITVEYIK